MNEPRVSLRGNVWRLSDLGKGPCWWYQQSQHVKVQAEPDLAYALDYIADLYKERQQLWDRETELREALVESADEAQELRDRIASCVL